MENRKVVIVDDEPDVVALAAESIRQDGWQPIIAADGAEAFATVTAEKPWLLIVGEHLSDMAGHELLVRLWREVSAEERPRRLMLLRPYTGGWFGRFSEYGEAARGIDMYLAKPFHPQELRAFLSRLHASLSAGASP